MGLRNGPHQDLTSAALASGEVTDKVRALCSHDAPGRRPADAAVTGHVGDGVGLLPTPLEQRPVLEGVAEPRQISDAVRLALAVLRHLEDAPGHLLGEPPGDGEPDRGRVEVRDPVVDKPVRETLRSSTRLSAAPISTYLPVSPLARCDGSEAIRLARPRPRPRARRRARRRSCAARPRQRVRSEAGQFAAEDGGELRRDAERVERGVHPCLRAFDAGLPRGDSAEAVP